MFIHALKFIGQIVSEYCNDRMSILYSYLNREKEDVSFTDLHISIFHEHGNPNDFHDYLFPDFLISCGKSNKVPEDINEILENLLSLAYDEESGIEVDSNIRSTTIDFMIHIYNTADNYLSQFKVNRSSIYSKRMKQAYVDMHKIYNDVMSLYSSLQAIQDRHYDGEKLTAIVHAVNTMRECLFNETGISTMDSLLGIASM